MLTEEVPDPPARNSAPTPAQAPAIRNTPLPPAPFTSSVPAPPIVPPDPQVLEKLEKKLSASMPQVYAAFLDQYEQLRDVIPDDTMRFKAALKTSKATSDQLAAAVDQLLQTMQNAATEFAKSFESNRGSLVGQIQASIKATEELIVSREQQRKAIDEEIASLRTKLQTDTERMHSEDARLETIKSGFGAALAQVTDRLNAQKSHILSQPRG